MESNSAPRVPLHRGDPGMSVKAGQWKKQSAVQPGRDSGGRCSQAANGEHSLCPAAQNAGRVGVFPRTQA